MAGRVPLLCVSPTENLKRTIRGGNFVCLSMHEDVPINSTKPQIKEMENARLRDVAEV